MASPCRNLTGVETPEKEEGKELKKGPSTKCAESLEKEVLRFEQGQEDSKVLAKKNSYQSVFFYLFGIFRRS